MSINVEYAARKLRHDSRSDRNRKNRFLYAMVVLVTPIIIGPVFGDLLGLGVGLIVSVANLSFVTIYTRGLEGNALLNIITGQLVNFGAGLRAKFHWDVRQRDEENTSQDRCHEQELKIVTVPHIEEYDTLSGPMKVVWGFQFMIDLALLDVYIGIDNSSIDHGLTGIISGFISGETGKMTATEARSAVEYIGFKARRAFIDIASESIPEDDAALAALQSKFGKIDDVKRGGGMREREAEYGIKLLLVYVEDIDYPDSVKKVLAAETENTGLLRIVAQNIGIDPKTLTTKDGLDMNVLDKIVNHQKFEDRMREARVVSANATEHVSNVVGNAGAAITAGMTRLLGNEGRK